MDSGNCVCEPGWAGLGCDSECSGHGQVIQGSCKCDIGWRGTLCDNPGCPGIDEDCSGLGECNSALHECTCDAGWTGVGCEIPDCPGNPDCLDRGRMPASDQYVILVSTSSKRQNSTKVPAVLFAVVFLPVLVFFQSVLTRNIYSLTKCYSFIFLCTFYKQNYQWTCYHGMNCTIHQVLAADTKEHEQNNEKFTCAKKPIYF
jgi:hypothetical protein